MLSRLLRGLGATSATLPELRAYCANPYSRQDGLPALPLADEPHALVWREYASEAAVQGAVAVLRALFPQFGFPIRAGISAEPAFRDATERGAPTLAGETGVEFADPRGITIAVHETPAGGVPVIVAGERADFEALVRAFAERNEPVALPAAMGACLVDGFHNWDRVARCRQPAAAALETESGAAGATPYAPLGKHGRRYQDRVLLLGSGPYGAVPAAAAGRGEQEWLRDSLRIRLEHECFHYLTARLFGVVRSNLLDELLADLAGLLSALGWYRADLALRLLGIAGDGALARDARLRVYGGSLSEEALKVLARLAVAVSRRLEGLAAELAPAARADVRVLLEWAGRGLAGLASENGRPH